MARASYHYWYDVTWRSLMMMMVVLSFFVAVDGKEYERKSHGVPAEIAPFLIKTATGCSLLECGTYCEEKSCEMMQYDTDSTNCSIYSAYMADNSTRNDVYSLPGAVDQRSCFAAAIKIFTGTLSVTSSNKTCQRWDAQHPHPHPYTQPDMFPDGTVYDNHNYCRDPSDSGYLWCYTTDPDGGGEPCSVYKCTSEDCITASPQVYTGTLNVTESNKPCQRWDSQTPESHDHTDASMYPDNTVSDAHNYCRDPSKSGIIWCYTTVSGTRWEPCDTYRCSTTGCYSIDVQLYKGTMNVTSFNTACQRWDTDSPTINPYTNAGSYPDATVAQAHNYCRDPSKAGRQHSLHSGEQQYLEFNIPTILELGGAAHEAFRVNYQSLSN